MLRISKKSFLIAFVAALILFSGIMAIVCYHAFSGHVFVHRDDAMSPQNDFCVTQPQIYYCYNPDTGVLEYAALVFCDAVSGDTYLMHVEGDCLVTYRDALYYVKSLYAADPEGALCLLFHDLTGANLDPATVADARSLLPESKKNSHLRYSALAELIADVKGTQLVEISPVFANTDAHRLIDVAETRRLFGAIEK